MRLGRQTFVVRAGSALHLTCRATRWPFKLIMLSNDIAADSLGRPVTSPHRFRWQRAAPPQAARRRRDSRDAAFDRLLPCDRHARTRRAVHRRIL
jgi:hypothetical protein